MKKVIAVLCSFVAITLSTLLMTATSANADSHETDAPHSHATINYSGKLVALPCTVIPGTENISVYMGAIPTKSLYRFTRTVSRLVELELKDCDPSLGDTIAIYFRGPVGADELLQFTPGSEAKGAGIGLEDLNGNPISINNSVPYKIAITEGDMTARMKAFVQGEQQALANKQLVPGEFTAILTYIMSYQ